jgi:1,4-dihydroxy-2-naphthoyl-CoA hydrolase
MSVTAEQVYALVPYARTLGVTFPRIEAEQVIAELKFTESLSTVGGGMHGGALMALADVAAAVLASATAGGALPATLESSTYFLERITGTATATATPLRVGRTNVIVEVNIRDGPGKLAVRVTQMIALTRPPRIT